MEWWGPDRFTCPSAKINLKVGGVSVIAMLAPNEFGGQAFYNTWQYTKIVPMERLEFIFNLSNKKGDKINPATVGMPADFPTDQPQVITFKDLGNGSTELTITEYGWLVGKMMKMAQMGMEKALANYQQL
jgi:uncharacterized protein YndB with AHSA1/START domain